MFITFSTNKRLNLVEHKDLYVLQIREKISKIYPKHWIWISILRTLIAFQVRKESYGNAVKVITLYCEKHFNAKFPVP